MAQKQFKIGLSNQDKQNMAQDVYERLLALTFPEYDTATEYDVGDFVVYNDQLYKCIGATSGAWDNTKWQLATLNDLLTDIESAVAFVNDKANVDGNYPTMTVGAADNLTPYDEDSGVNQEQPFLLQGTGCGNGEQQVDTGALALLKEKRGNTVVVNQQILDANKSKSFATTDSDIKTIQSGIPVVQGQKWLMIWNQSKTLTSNVRNTPAYKIGENARVYQNATENANLSAGVKFWLIDIGNTGLLDLTYWGNTPNESFDITDISFANLTQWFGSNDNIPAHLLAHPEDFFRYYQGSLDYNEGTLVNANGRYLKTIGRQRWDEVIEIGSIDSEGQNYNDASGSFWRSKNYIRVIPNTDYYVKLQKNYTLYTSNIGLKFYDKDKNFITTIDNRANNHTKTPENACYMRFVVFIVTPSQTAPQEIVVSLYYEGESGYDQYYPYEVLANIDTGTEVLRSAGSVKDSKAPDGTITRRVGSYTFTGSESWNFRNSDGNFDYYSVSVLTSLAKPDFLSKLICSNGAELSAGAYVGATKLCMGIDNNSVYIAIPTSSNPNSIFSSGTVLNYELAEPTTEQGTPYSENLVIDDFGSMDFGGTSGVPQGASIFYAVDYKAFVDSLYNTLDGDATDIVKESELDSKLATLGYVKLTSVSGYDATKTQVLKNVEGTLTWVTEE